MKKWFDGHQFVPFVQTGGQTGRITTASTRLALRAVARKKYQNPFKIHFQNDHCHLVFRTYVASSKADFTWTERVEAKVRLAVRTQKHKLGKSSSYSSNLRKRRVLPEP